MGDAGRHMGLIGGRMHGRAGGAFAGRHGRSVLDKRLESGDWDPDLRLFWERVNSTPEEWKIAYNNLFLSLKDAEVFGKADVIQIYCGHNEADSRLNIVKNSHNSNAINSPTFSAKNNFKGNGSSSYLEINYSPKTEAVNYKMNDCTLLVVRDEYNASGVVVDLGAALESGTSQIADQQPSTIYSALNSKVDIKTLTANITGVAATSRISSTEIEETRGVTSLTVALNSSYIPAGKLNVFRRQPDGYYSNNAISAIYIGAYLNATQRQIFKNIITDFKTEIASL